MDELGLSFVLLMYGSSLIAPIVGLAAYLGYLRWQDKRSDNV